VIPISIDISDFVNKWNLSVQQADLLAYNILDEVSLNFAEEWRKVAGQELHQTKQEYQRSIYIEKPDKDSVIVGLKGFMPNAVERGIASFDEKTGFSKSTKRKVKKNGGWYLTIPFRFAVPGSVAESSIFSQILPGAVYKVALNTLKNAGDKLQAKQLPAQFQVKGVRPEIVSQAQDQIFAQYEHKSSPYEGMIKSQGGYMTFRRVSDTSDPNAWIHSGIQAYNLSEKALANLQIDRIISNIKNNFIENQL
jgi:hypothetical protein